MVAWLADGVLGSVSGTVVLVAVLATLLGATLQSATGFGFALVAGPVLFGALGSAEAVTTLLVVGAVLNALVLFGERRRPAVRWAELGTLLTAALPGLAAGVVIIGIASKAGLQVAVGIGVLVAVLLQVRRPALPAGGPASSAGTWPRVAVGLTVGVLTTTTSTNGPPLVLWFQRLQLSTTAVRDSVTAAFLALNVLGAGTLVLLGGAGPALDPPLVAMLVLVAALGHQAGRFLFRRLDAARFRLAGLVLSTVAGVASIAAGLTG